MNKRQAKKKKRNEILFCGMTYREDRQLEREMQEFETRQRRNKDIPEDFEILVELGFYTWEDAKRMHNKKRRWRQLKR